MFGTVGRYKVRYFRNIYRGFSAKHAALRRKSKDWFAQNHPNVSKWEDMSICGLLFE
jgi:hypothetical protein